MWTRMHLSAQLSGNRGLLTVAGCALAFWLTASFAEEAPDVLRKEDLEETTVYGVDEGRPSEAAREDAPEPGIRDDLEQEVLSEPLPRRTPKTQTLDTRREIIAPKDFSAPESTSVE